MKKRCAIYIRVSTAEQAEQGYSIQAQKEKLLAYCKSRDWFVQNIYIDDGYTGANMDRPLLQKLLSDIENIDVVLVYRLDRLSRSQKDTLYLIEDVFMKNKVDIISLSESFDTTSPFGRASIGILSVFSQLERETIRDRSILGRVERAKEGLYHGGLAPVGYEYKDGKLIINDYESLQVQKIFNLYLQGYGVGKIVKIMKEKGYNHKYGGYNHNTNVTNILDNPVYSGKIYHKGEIYIGKHKAIIPEDTFKRAQELRNNRKGHCAKVFERDSLLSGFIFCARCGARYSVVSMRMKKGIYYRYYACYSRTKSTIRMIKDPNCKNNYWLGKNLDTLIENKILQLSIDNSVIFSQKKIKEIKKEEEVKTLKKKAESLDKQINKFLDLYQTDILPAEEISIRINSLYIEKKSILENIKILENKEETHNKEELEKIISNLKDVWDGANIMEKRMLIEYLIDRIEIDGEEVIVSWRF